MMEGGVKQDDVLDDGLAVFAGEGGGGLQRGQRGLGFAGNVVVIGEAGGPPGAAHGRDVGDAELGRDAGDDFPRQPGFAHPVVTVEQVSCSADQFIGGDIAAEYAEYAVDAGSEFGQAGVRWLAVEQGDEDGGHRLQFVRRAREDNLPVEQGYELDDPRVEAGKIRPFGIAGIDHAGDGFEACHVVACRGKAARRFGEEVAGHGRVAAEVAAAAPVADPRRALTQFSRQAVDPAAQGLQAPATRQRRAVGDDQAAAFVRGTALVQQGKGIGEIARAFEKFGCAALQAIDFPGMQAMAGTRRKKLAEQRMVLIAGFGAGMALDEVVLMKQFAQNAFGVRASGELSGQGRRESGQDPGGQEKVPGVDIRSVQNFRCQEVKCGFPRVAMLRVEVRAAIGWSGQHQGQAGSPAAAGFQ
jgi:hypothetical protein